MAITREQEMVITTPESNGCNFSQGGGIEGLRARWQLWRGEKALPNIRDFKANTFAPFRNNALLIDIRQGPARPSLRFKGPGLPGAQKQMIEKLKPFIVKAAKSKKPGPALLPLTNGRRPGSNLSGLLLPLGEGDGKVVFLLAYFEPAIKLSEATSDPASPATANYLKLSRRLDEIQTLTRQLALTRGQGRKALFRTLAQISLLYRESRSSPEAYGRLLQQAGLKQQSRAPFTPVLKLAFGKNYDKTRMTEYAAVLRYAERHRIAAEEMEGFLRQNGGLKACLRAERIIRRRNAGATPDKTAETRDWLRGIRPLAAVTLPKETMAGSAQEFMLLLARRNLEEKSQNIDILDMMEYTAEQVEKTLNNLYHGKIRHNAAKASDKF